MLVITPNLAFDSTIACHTLEAGTVSRARTTELTAGGKGVNVVRAWPKGHSNHPRLIGFIPHHGGAQLIELLRDENVEFVGVPIDGAVRICTIVLEEDGRATVINGPGPTISTAGWQAFRRSASAEMPTKRTVVCNGSLPPGVANVGYAEIVSDAHAAGCRVLLDAGPAPLASALSLQPDAVFPNLAEVESLLWGRSSELVDEQGADVPQRALIAATDLLTRGAQRAVVTAGAAGAALATSAGCWWISAPSVAVVSTIGAGDSFVAGFANKFVEGASDIEAAVLGIATAAASCEQQLAGGVDHQRVQQLIHKVTVEQIITQDIVEVQR